MNFSHAINKLIASVGGVLLVAYEFIKFYKTYENHIYDNTYIMDNPYVPFSTFLIMSFTYLFLNIFSHSKNSIANALKGFLGCFLITYAFLFFSNQLYLTLEFGKSEPDLVRDSTYLSIFLLAYFFSLCIESYWNLSRSILKKENRAGSIKIEV
ncbi:hypothetical protein, conserved [Plasmodium gonderi]|uniref:Uncharacterized protein n=1 Tax=Plasmodium gonderi TaxID=77519 RepID=A0A1Y1JIX8_PLAGO|nr:hypothetical protein, conserved [Plasmodium gonderi]GAW81315.1 hypothetical protein, conserved [Plasmodium gonderi]